MYQVKETTRREGVEAGAGPPLRDPPPRFLPPARVATLTRYGTTTRYGNIRHSAQKGRLSIGVLLCQIPFDTCQIPFDTSPGSGFLLRLLGLFLFLLNGPGLLHDCPSLRDDVRHDLK